MNTAPSGKSKFSCLASSELVKAYLTGLLVLIAGSFPAFAQNPGQHSISISAETMQSGGLDQNADGTRANTVDVPTGDHLATHLHTSQTDSSSDSESIQITVHNFSPMADSAEVDWYFVAAPLNGGQRYIADKGSKTVSLAGNGITTIPVTSNPINSQSTSHSKNKIGRHGNMHRGTAGATQDSGDKLQGWMVRLVAGGRVLGSAGSTDDLADTARDDEKLQSMMTKPSDADGGQ